ncbi:NAD-dependent epimerase/dehydratase family protein [Nocardiopsis quinghaiensis]|uniref:NAD-dependent epimerase/dehydratase family protein n=1 Tax=Nocardiopsis quinghaiensis TaxID=464995 RepID=UPI001238E214|nr:NAD-dependent epimerase/dehydratase family protein [Nocardiopsis quinghaiensis]
MTRAVVTGGRGFVGSHLVDRLVARGDEVTVFDTGRRATQAARRHVDARFVTGDIRNPDELAAVITKDVDVVYHLAAVVGVDQYLATPLDVIDTNFTGTRNVLERAAEAGTRLVLASTSEVSGMNPAVPWTEDADRVLGSTSVNRWSYSSSKALAEHLTFAFVRQRGLDASIVRYFNLYGPRQRPAFLISRTVHRCLNGLPPIVYDEGKQTRTFTSVHDAVGATVRIGASEAASGECFNVGNSTEMTIQEAVELIVELTGCDAGTKSIDTEQSFGVTYQDLGRRVPDTTKLRTLIGARCDTGLREGVTRLVEWAAANPWWLELEDDSPS